MSNITDTSALSNNFSWHRVAMVAQYYWPSIKKQMLIYIAVSMAVGLASVFFSLYPSMGTLMGFFIGLAELATTFMLYWSPVVFTSHSSIEMETMLPVKVSEKAAFILPYVLIGVPLMIYIPEGLITLGLGEVLNLPIAYSYKQEFVENFTTLHGLFGRLEMYVPLTTCLYVVFRSNKSRFTKGVVWSIVSVVGLGIVSAVWAIAIFFNNIGSGDIVIDLQKASGDESLLYIIDCFSLVMLISVVLYSVLMSCLTVRALKCKQI